MAAALQSVTITLSVMAIPYAPLPIFPLSLFLYWRPSLLSAEMPDSEPVETAFHFVKSAQRHKREDMLALASCTQRVRRRIRKRCVFNILRWPHFPRNRSCEIVQLRRGHRRRARESKKTFCGRVCSLRLKGARRRFLRRVPVLVNTYTFLQYLLLASTFGTHGGMFHMAV
jgi:hypothetical protein